MEREDDLIDLGTASVETRGNTGAVLDQISGLGFTGLSDE